MNDFRGYLDRTRERVNRALAEVLDDYLEGASDWLATPIRYACEGGGKRLRPILFLAGYEVSGRSSDGRVDRLATSVEIVHSYSLVHDDLPCMDDDDWRRGRLTCHRAFGVERATIAAAAMVPLAGWVIAAEAEALGFGPDERATLVAELSEAAGPAGMVGGQVLDLIYEDRPIGEAQLGEIHRRKTGALIRASARLGGWTGRLDGPRLEALTRYGEKVGLAFQIADDLLDEAEVGDEQRGARSDLELNKATYPGMYGSEVAREKASRLSREAIEALRAAGVRSPELESLALHVVERES